MTASAVALAGLPLATLAFLGFLGTTVTAMLAIVSGPLLAMGAALFTILLMLSCLTRGRALVVIRAGEIALAERDETVRLVLRAFADKGADALRATAAARSVPRARPTQ